MGKHRLRILENRVLRIFYLGRRRWPGGSGEDCIMRSFIICTLHQISLC
jgi:hypothetical protein